MKRINLLPLEARQKKSGDWLRSLFFGSTKKKLIVFVVILFIAFNFWQTSNLLGYRHVIEKEKDKIRKLQSHVSRAQSEAEKINEKKKLVEDETKKLRNIYDLLNEIEEEGMPFANTLKHLSELIHPELWLTEIQLKKDLVRITGTTLNHSTVSVFMKSLDTSEYFYNTSFTYTQQDKLEERTVIHFQITTQFQEL